ncbi:MAG: hypothetical protein HC841_07135 [Verrucomicrobiae bacterium]|nr:hypothetical protein [Verrucomicrobiae bacterium]
MAAALMNSAALGAPTAEELAEMRKLAAEIRFENIAFEDASLPEIVAWLQKNGRTADGRTISFTTPPAAPHPPAGFD